MSNSLPETKFYNYIYLDPRKPGQYSYEGLPFSLLFEPFYVGKGCKTGKNERKFAHLNETNWKRDENKYKINKIRKLIKLGFHLENFILQFNKEITSEFAYEIEKETIKYIGRLDKGKGPLLNLSNGGTGGIPENFPDVRGIKNPQSLFYLVNVKGLPEIEAKLYLKNKGQKCANNRRSYDGNQNPGSLEYLISVKGLNKEDADKKLKEKGRKMIETRIRNTGSSKPSRHPRARQFKIILENKETINFESLREMRRYCIQNNISSSFIEGKSKSTKNGARGKGITLETI